MYNLLQLFFVLSNYLKITFSNNKWNYLVYCFLIGSNATIHSPIYAFNVEPLCAESSLFFLLTMNTSNVFLLLHLIRSYKLFIKRILNSIRLERKPRETNIFCVFLWNFICWNHENKKSSNRKCDVFFRIFKYRSKIKCWCEFNETVFNWMTQLSL